MKIDSMKEGKKYFIKDYDGFRKKFYEEMNYIYITYYYMFKNRKPATLKIFDLVSTENHFIQCVISFKGFRRSTRFRSKEILELYLSFFEEYHQFIQEEMDI